MGSCVGLSIGIYNERNTPGRYQNGIVFENYNEVTITNRRKSLQAKDISYNLQRGACQDMPIFDDDPEEGLSL